MLDGVQGGRRRLGEVHGRRFVTDAHTRLHVHTGDVSPDVPLLVVPDVGPKVHLKKHFKAFPDIDEATPYGSGRLERTAFLFGQDQDAENYATTANTTNPIVPEELTGLTERFRLSLFFRPDATTTSGADALIAGIPSQLGLYQRDGDLVLRMQPYDDPLPAVYEDVLSGVLEPGAWHLLEVQWDMAKNGGVLMSSYCP